MKRVKFHRNKSSGLKITVAIFLIGLMIRAFIVSWDGAVSYTVPLSLTRIQLNVNDIVLSREQYLRFQKCCSQHWNSHVQCCRVMHEYVSEMDHHWHHWFSQWLGATPLSEPSMTSCLLGIWKMEPFCLDLIVFHNLCTIPYIAVDSEANGHVITKRFCCLSLWTRYI